MTVERDDGFRAGELLPCPFCGNSNLELYRPALGRVWHVHCEDCEISGAGAVDRETAALEWNTRTLLPANAGQPDGGVEVVVAALQARYDQIEQQWRDEPIAALANQKIATGRCLQIAKRIAASAPAAREGEEKA